MRWFELNVLYGSLLSKFLKSIKSLVFFLCKCVFVYLRVVFVVNSFSCYVDTSSSTKHMHRICGLWSFGPKSSPALVWPVNHHMLIYFISNRYASNTYCLAKINNMANKGESTAHSFAFLVLSPDSSSPSSQTVLVIVHYKVLAQDTV